MLFSHQIFVLVSRDIQSQWIIIGTFLAILTSTSMYGIEEKNEKQIIYAGSLDQVLRVFILTSKDKFSRIHTKPAL